MIRDRVIVSGLVQGSSTTTPAIVSDITVIEEPPEGLPAFQVR